MNETQAVKRLKLLLGPVVGQFFTDEEVLELGRIALYEFARYVPDVGEIKLDTTDPAVQVPGRTNEFFIEDPEGAEIGDVLDVIPEESTALLAGYAYVPPLGNEMEYADFGLQLTRANKNYALLKPSWEFKPPNILRIYGKTYNLLPNVFVVKYTRIPKSFSQIPAQLWEAFFKLWQASVLEALANRLQNFASVQSLGAEINPNPDFWNSKAEQLKNEARETLRNIPPPVIGEIY